MSEVPLTGAVAEYRGQRYRILFSSDDWVALCVHPDAGLDDAFARGQSPAGRGTYTSWAKVPREALDGVVAITSTATLGGHTVSLRSRTPDGRISVEFIGPPAVARQLGLDGDQYMGWAGLFDPDDLENIYVEETPLA